MRDLGEHPRLFDRQLQLTNRVSFDRNRQDGMRSNRLIVTGARWARIALADWAAEQLADEAIPHLDQSAQKQSTPTQLCSQRTEVSLGCAFGFRRLVAMSKPSLPGCRTGTCNASCEYQSLGFQLTPRRRSGHFLYPPPVRCLRSSPRLDCR